MDPGRSGINRRRHYRVAPEGAKLEVFRVGMTARVRTSAASPTPNLATRLLDVSGGGVRLISWVPLNKRDKVRVKLKIPSWKNELTASAIVKWAKPVQEDNKEQYEVGAEFTDLSSEDRIRLHELQPKHGK